MLYGDGTGSYQWTGVAGPDAIAAFETAIQDLTSGFAFNGLPYLPPDSNIFVFDVLVMTGTELSAGNRATIGCAPGLSCLGIP